MNIKPLVSAILPIFNGRKYLKAAVESVLQQDYPALEIFLVDDGSTDGSGEIARTFQKAICLQQPNRGVAAARNLALAAARGDFIAFLDQDDLWMPRKISAQVKFLLENPGLDFCLSKERLFLEGSTLKPIWLKENLLRDDHRGFILGCAVIRAATFKKVGPFDPSFRFGSDADWFFRAKDAGVQWGVVDEVLLLKRVHADNETHKVSGMRADMFKLVRNSIQRQSTLPSLEKKVKP